MNESLSETKNHPPEAIPWSTADIAVRAQLLLRILGLYFVIAGGCYLVPPMVSLVYVLWRELNDGSMANVAFYQVMHVISYFLMVLAGQYLLIDGRWVIEKFFLPASEKEPDELQDNLEDNNQ
ncbi:MAG: hypothetical protein ACWGMZ_02935 [Thermoguttaceae bacterium]